MYRNGMKEMSKYEKPKCDCGEKLLYWTQPVQTLLYKINKNGRQAKNPCSYGVSGEGCIDRLICNTCDSEYDIEFDEKSRVIRGGVYSY